MTNNIQNWDYRNNLYASLAPGHSIAWKPEASVKDPYLHSNQAKSHAKLDTSPNPNTSVVSVSQKTLRWSVLRVLANGESVVNALLRVHRQRRVEWVESDRRVTSYIGLWGLSLAKFEWHYRRLRGGGGVGPWMVHQAVGGRMVTEIDPIVESHEESVGISANPR